MEKIVEQIKNNLSKVSESISEAANRTGRKNDDIKIIIVSKFQPSSIIKAAWEAGGRYFGENYPEQAVDKIIELRCLAGIEWHMIGHLQSRKSSIVAEHFNMIHSLDSISLAERLNHQLLNRNMIMPVMLEFNVSGEENKNGWQASNEEEWDKLISEIQPIYNLPYLNLIGLMTMPPFFEDPEKTRPFFSKLRKLRDYMNRNFPERKLFELSMGTSVDYSIAVEEGATYVRIGQAILGNRPIKE